MSSGQESIADLVDQKKLSEHREAAEEKYGHLTSDQVEHLRRRCKTDLFFLANGPLEYTKLSPRFHGHYIRWLEAHKGSQYRATLLPRGHYKSTVNTKADSIQMALPNVAEVQEYPYCLGPNIKILIAHEVREKAARFLYDITAAFTRKPLMLALFPECIPDRSTMRVSKWELELPRTEHHSEATFDTIGAGGAAQGGHYNWLKLDDLIGKKARDSATTMEGTKFWFDNVNSLLTDPLFDGFDLVGTRWAYNDVYSHAFEVYGVTEEESVIRCMPQKEIDKYSGGLLKLYARGAIEGDKPIFHERFSLDWLEARRKRPLIWAAQYANNPMESGLTEFPWPLKFYNVSHSGDIVVFTGESRKRIKLRDLDVCILCDPSMGETRDADPSGIVVTGTDDQFNVYILETIKRRLLPPEFIDELYRLNFKYSPRIIAIEEVNFSAIYRYWINEKGAETQVFLPTKPYKPGSKRSKDARIRGLAHLFSAGQVYVHEGMHSFRDEYEQFPMGASEHLLDALAQGPQFWSKGLAQQEIDHRREAVEEILAERSSMTGY